MKPQPEFSEAEVVGALEILIPTPERDPQTVQRARAAFLEQASILRSPVTFGPIYRLKLWIASLSNYLFSSKLRPLTIAIAMFMLVFVGSGVTTAAAQAALPGDNLYALKLLVEETRLQLTNDLDKDFALHIQFAYERVDELQKLAELGREADAYLAEENFQAHYAEAHEEASVLNAAQVEALDAVYAAYLEVVGEVENTDTGQPESTEENEPVIPAEEDDVEEEVVPVETQSWHLDKMEDGAKTEDSVDAELPGDDPAEGESEPVEAEEEPVEEDDEPEGQDEDQRENDNLDDDEPDSDDDDLEEKEDDEKDESDPDEDSEEDD